MIHDIPFSTWKLVKTSNTTVHPAAGNAAGSHTQHRQGLSQDLDSQHIHHQQLSRGSPCCCLATLTTLPKVTAPQCKTSATGYPRPSHTEFHLDRQKSQCQHTKYQYIHSITDFFTGRHRWTKQVVDITGSSSCGSL